MLLEKCISLVRLFNVDIGYLSEPVMSIIQSAEENAELRELTFLSELANGEEADFSNRWKSSVEEFALNSPLKKEDIRLLLSFGEVLGTTDSAHQTKLCGDYAQHFLKQYEEAEKNKKERLRLYRSAGVLCGAAVFVLFI